jgi:hypothetical protein
VGASVPPAQSCISASTLPSPRVSGHRTQRLDSTRAPLREGLSVVLGVRWEGAWGRVQDDGCPCRKMASSA